MANGIGLKYTDPYTLVFLRFGIASITILAVSPFIRGVSLVKDLRKKSTWVMGGVYALGFLLRYVGQADASASEASLLSNLAPALVPTLAALTLKERVNSYQKVATVLGFLGLVVIASPSVDLGPDHLVGDVLLFGTSVCIATFILLGKKEGANSVSSAFAITSTMALFLAPAALAFGGNDLLRVGAITWGTVVYLGIPCSVVPLALYLRGLSSITASLSATVLFLQLLVGFVLSIAAFGAPYAFPEFAGAVSISAAVILAAQRSK